MVTTDDSDIAIPKPRTRRPGEVAWTDSRKSQNPVGLVVWERVRYYKEE